MGDLESFRKLGITETTIAALQRKGFEEPSPIQAAVIPLLLAGEKDVIGQAQTGTGKTAAFGIPVIETLKTSKKHVQALIMTPTRELTIQIAEELNSLKGDRGLKIAPVYGGQSIEIQLSKLRTGVDIVVGTPGRLMDLMERRALDISHVSFAILDEADEMLSMGFVEDIENILSVTPEDKKMLMFSATMPSAILNIASRFMREYEIVNVKRDTTSVSLTEQIYFEVRREDKLEALARIIDMESDLYAMVFCRTRNDVDELHEKLTLRGYDVESLHGDIAQAQRTRVIEGFKRRKFNVLIATDVAARGIDVNNLTHVINFSIPQDPDLYIHRIGRTGRAGREGTAITFVTPSEYRLLTRIRKESNADIRKERLPDPNTIVARKKENFVGKISEMIESHKHEPYVKLAEELIEKIPAPELVASILRMQFKSEFLPEHYASITDPYRNDSGRSVDNRGRTRLFIALGKDQGYGAGNLVKFIQQKTGIPSSSLGKVDCFNDFSFVEASFNEAEEIIRAFQSQGRAGQPFVEIAKDSPKSSGGNRGGDRRERGHRDDSRRDDRRGGSWDKRGDGKRPFKFNKGGGGVHKGKHAGKHSK